MVIRMEKNIIVMCFVLCLKLTSWGRPKDATMQESLSMQLGRLSEITATLDELSCFCFLVVC